MPKIMFDGTAYGLGGDKGNANVVEMTQSEYDALPNPDPETIYFITDANAPADVGNTDISKIGDGTITGAIGAVNEGVSDIKSNLGAKVKTKSGSFTIGNDTWAQIDIGDDLNIVLNIGIEVESGKLRYPLYDISTHFTYHTAGSTVSIRSIGLKAGTYNYIIAYI